MGDAGRGPDAAKAGKTALLGAAGNRFHFFQHAAGCDFLLFWARTEGKGDSQRNHWNHKKFEIHNASVVKLANEPEIRNEKARRGGLLVRIHYWFGGFVASGVVALTPPVVAVPVLVVALNCCADLMNGSGFWVSRV